APQQSLLPFQFNDAKFNSLIYIYNLSKFPAIYRNIYNLTTNSRATTLNDTFWRTTKFFRWTNYSQTFRWTIFSFVRSTLKP
ncbi:MAG: hypothetical protein ACKO96_10800, partial [Flammeovirgaceae bacterium]